MVPEIELVIAGDGPQRRELEERGRALGVSEKVRFVGYRSDVPELIASFDTYVLPSLWEGLPLALLEALAQGTPIVATTVGGNPEIVEDGTNGFLVPPADGHALADRILRAYRDGDLRARICEANKKKFASSFSLDAMLKRYEALFDQQMAAKSAHVRGSFAPLAQAV